MREQLALHGNQAGERVLVVSTRSGEAARLVADARAQGFDVQATHSVACACKELSGETFDVCVIDDADASEFAAEVAAHLKAIQSRAQLVCLINKDITGIPTRTPPVPCGLLEKPYSPISLYTVLSASARQSQLLLANRRLERRLVQRGLREMVGNSRVMQTLRARVQAAADQDGPILVRGEPGTGTHLVAHAIHHSSRYVFRPFVRLDCRLLSTDVLQRELLSSSRDGTTVTAGNQARNGLPSEAGTVFLDHVDCLSLPLQKKLVRVMKRLGITTFDKRGGGRQEGRMIAATHADLTQRIRRGQFREDLYRCLADIEITTPPLRERRDDILPLAEHFLNRLVVREGKPARRISLDALELLENYDWPGNVRELANVIERACSLDFGPRLTAEMVRPWLAGQRPNKAARNGGLASTCEAPSTGSRVASQGMTLKEMERKLIETTFNRCGGNRERTAQTLQIGLRTLSGKLREYGYPPRGGPGSNQKTFRRKAA